MLLMTRGGITVQPLSLGGITVPGKAKVGLQLASTYVIFIYMQLIVNKIFNLK